MTTTIIPTHLQVVYDENTGVTVEILTVTNKTEYGLVSEVFLRVPAYDYDFEYCMALPHEQPNAEDGHTHYTLDEIYEWSVKAIVNNYFIEDYIKKASTEDDEDDAAIE